VESYFIMLELPHQATYLGRDEDFRNLFIILELPCQAPDVVFVEVLMGSTYLKRDEDLRNLYEIFYRLGSLVGLR
jgi:hypothetical protein